MNRQEKEAVVDRMLDGLNDKEMITLAVAISRMDPAFRISEYDRTNVGAIIAGEGDWWGAHLLRLIHKSDQGHRALLSIPFSTYVDAYLAWCNAPGGVVE